MEAGRISQVTGKIRFRFLSNTDCFIPYIWFLLLNKVILKELWKD